MNEMVKDMVLAVAGAVLYLSAIFTAVALLWTYVKWLVGVAL